MSAGRPREHAKRPVLGLECARREVSGSRLWGWAKADFGTADAFFARFFVANYCPLVFMEASGRNLTPDKLPPAERGPLFASCDQALRQTVALLRPRYAVGVGAFAQRPPRAGARGYRRQDRGHSSPQPGQPARQPRLGRAGRRQLAEMGIAPRAARTTDGVDGGQLRRP